MTDSSSFAGFAELVIGGVLDKRSAPSCRGHCDVAPVQSHRPISSTSGAAVPLAILRDHGFPAGARIESRAGHRPGGGEGS